VLCQRVEQPASGAVNDDEDLTHALLTDLTSVLLGLELLARRGELSERQAAIADAALRAARSLRARMYVGAQRGARGGTAAAHQVSGGQWKDRGPRIMPRDADG